MYLVQFIINKKILCDHCRGSGAAPGDGSEYSHLLESFARG